MINDNELRQVDLAHLAGVVPRTARTAMRGKLKPALTPDGTRVYRDHPLVVAYINRQEPKRGRALRASAQRQSAATLPAPPAPSVNDPFSAAAKLSQQGPAPGLAERVAAQERERGDNVLISLSVSSAGELPRDIAALRALTLGEVVDRWGSLEALGAASKAAKLYAEFRLREGEALKKRGELIDRKVITGVILPLVETAFRRLTAEAPGALRESIIARVMSGGESLPLDVEKLIHDQNSGILESCIKTMQREIERLAK